jgi:hypothetical protein
LHFASFAPAWHFQGLSCGPENTGPPIGWSVSVMRAPAPPGSVTLRTFGPERRRVTTPRRRRLPLRVNAFLTLRLPTLTLARRTSEEREKSTRTSAEWPLTRSARPDSTWIETFDALPGLAVATGATGRQSAAVAAARVIRRLVIRRPGP